MLMAVELWKDNIPPEKFITGMWETHPKRVATRWIILCKKIHWTSILYWDKKQTFRGPSPLELLEERRLIIVSKICNSNSSNNLQAVFLRILLKTINQISIYKRVEFNLKLKKKRSRSPFKGIWLPWKMAPRTASSIKTWISNTIMNIGRPMTKKIIKLMSPNAHALTVAKSLQTVEVPRRKI
jgi:hypothetical protein